MAGEPHVPRPQKIKLPPIPPSQLPQHVAPSRMSKGLQIGSFALATGITFYAVLVYDFGPREHCFMPVRRWFDDKTQGFFTLTDSDRQTLAPGAAAQPDRRTPVEFFAKGEQQTGDKKVV